MRRLVLIVPILVVVLAGWPSVTGASGVTAAQILQLSVSNMKNEGSFHYTSTSSIAGKVALRLSTDSALTYGTQTQQLDGGTETTRLIGSKLYLYANATAYRVDFDVKTTTLANRWVLVPKTNKNYGNIADAILVKSVMQQLLDIGKVKLDGSVTIGGQSAIALEGDAGASGTEFIYVSSRAPYLPLGLSAEATEDGHKIVNELVFSKWGEKFQVAVPAKYVVATSTTFP